MPVMHAALETGDELLVWVERGDAAPEDSFALTAQELAALVPGGVPVDARATLPTAAGRPIGSTEASEAFVGASLEAWPVPARRLGIPEAIDLLTTPADQELRNGSGFEAIARLARHAGALVLRHEFLPDVRSGETTRACWTPMPGPDARDAFDRAIRALPDSARALRVEDPIDFIEVPASARAARFATNVVDELVRARLTAAPVELDAGTPRSGESLHDRWLRALTSEDPTIDGPPDALDRLAADVQEWQHRIRHRAETPWRLCVRLEEPDDPTDDADGDDAGASWTLRYLVQLRDDPSVLLPASTAWAPTGPDAKVLRARGFHAGEHLLAPLADAARWFEPMAASLREEHPAGCELDTTQAHDFLANVATVLEQAGCGVFVPAWWRGRGGRWQVSLRAELRSQLDGGRQHMDSLNLATLVGYDWRMAVGDETLTRQELERLAAQKSTLVKVRGKWVELDPGELRAALAHMERYQADPTAPSRGGTASVGQLVRMSMGAVRLEDGVRVSGVVDESGADVATLLQRALDTTREEAATYVPPAGLRATLRPYQERGAAWLSQMATLELGACLADDMGLGKSVQALAAVQQAWERDVHDGTPHAPTIVVCPTTVLTNWRREAERFTPELPVLVHHGSGRAAGDELLELAASTAVIFTSYAVLARDIETLAQVDWRMAVLDEAQQVKNPSTRHARAARLLRARARVALTGTPVENHAGDLWSIMEFLNPGLLGSQADFRRKYLIPIQTGTFPEAAERLRRIVEPFVLRREKTDPDVIADLPDKFEHVVPCLLTKEQVSLYEAVVRDAAQTLRMSRDDARRSGIERRGLILATIARLKQVCNHPAQLLGDNSRVAGRSGKLLRLEQLLETVLDGGERALVFTQFVTMGELLQRHLRETFGRDVLFLHGGTPRARRDEIVDRFQDPSSDAPPILVLSLKAGGSGLNLTAATHVFHFDRWWNPATEQQASDRAFRIGQTRDVQVHAMVCRGTVEERVDVMLRQKRAVADSVVGSGERWITEFDDDELLDLLQLRSDSMLQSGRLDDLDAKEWQRGSL